MPLAAPCPLPFATPRTAPGSVMFAIIRTALGPLMLTSAYSIPDLFVTAVVVHALVSLLL